MIEVDLRRRLVELETKVKEMELDKKRMEQDFDTKLYFLNNDIKICEMYAKRIEENVFKLSRRMPLPKPYKPDSELSQILQEIKDKCLNRQGCIGCKFHMKDGGCVFDYLPYEWELDKIGLAESEEL